MIIFSEFKDSIKKLEKIFNKKLDDETITLYFEILSSRFKNTEEFWESCKRVVANWKIANTFPPIAEFLAIEKTDDLEIQKEISLIKKAMQEVGAYSSVAFSPRVNLIVKLKGGWSIFCRLSTQEVEEFFKWEFKNQYKAFKGREDVPVYLAGIHEANAIAQQLEYDSKPSNYVLDKKETLKILKINKEKAMMENKMKLIGGVKWQTSEN